MVIKALRRFWVTGYECIDVGWHDCGLSIKGGATEQVWETLPWLRNIWLIINVLSCPWRPPPAPPPAPPSGGRWDEVLSKRLAPRCSRNRSISPTPYHDRPHSLWRCGKLNFLKDNISKCDSSAVWPLSLQWRSVGSYAHCWTVWSCPWGSQGSCRAEQRK